uniref:amidohydrolase n=1 Tax=uncultured Bilophila sp. TaxID=529385 RepID=UPI0025EFF45E|nr:amidohydrolase [uncultured Bilophila sp.]
MRHATHIYRNGVILTMDSRCSIVSSLAVRGETILAVGSDAETSPFRDAETRVVDLGGAFMMPGFYDCHSHFMRAGMYNRYYLDVNSHPIGTVRTHEDIRRKVREALEGLPAGEWLLCAGYDDTAVAEGRHFTLAELDAMAPDHPLFLRHISGHLALCNSRAFEAAGITDDTLNPAGGLFRRDAEGHLTGLVEEPAAMDTVLEASPQMTEEKWLGALERATTDYVAKGVTTAHDGGVTTPMWRNYMLAHKRGMLKNRVQLLPKHGFFDFSLAPTTRCGAPLTNDGLLNMGAVKLFQDGSLQGYTGYLSNPYHRVPDDLPDGDLWRGYPIHHPQRLVDLVSGYHRQGWQVAIHGNGDAGIDDILTAFEEAQKVYPRADARHIVIHCQTVREDQLDRIERLGVVPSFFTVHTYYWGDRHRDIFLGESRAARINPLRSALKRGIRFTSHNDTAVTPMDPLLSVWSAVNRLTGSGRVLGPNQTIPVLDALKSVTIWGAYQFHEERTKGSLEPGKLADMVVLGENPLAIAPERLRDIPILATLVGNRLVYGSL